MSRLVVAMRTDGVLMARNQLYAISIGVSALIAGVMAKLTTAQNSAGTFPAALLMVAGGSTLLYVTGMIILERAEGTLDAVSVSPLRPWEYIASKVAMLTGLAVLEGALIVAGGWWWASRTTLLDVPNVPLGVVAMAILGAVHVLVGVILVVRYRSFMDVLLPMGGIAMVMQMPALYFIGAVEHRAMLLIPTGAPTMLLRGAFTPLHAWEWVYGLGGSVVLLAALCVWSLRAFDTHVTQRAG